MRRLFLAIAFVLACGGIAHASIARTNQWTSASHSASCGSGCTFSITVAPTAGNLEVWTIYGYNGCLSQPTVSPGTWTIATSATCGSTKNTTWVFWHIAQAGETSYSVTFTSASGTTYYASTVFEYAGANTTTPFDVVPSYAAPAGATSVAAPSITTTQDGDMLVSTWANSSTGSTGVTAGWTAQNAGSSANVFLTVADELQGAHGATTAPASTFASAPGNIQTTSYALAPASASSNTGSTVPFTWAGGPHLSLSLATPTPAPANTPPPPQTYVLFGQYGENVNTTNAQITQYLNAYCEGQETNTAGASIFNCPQGQTQYWSLNIGQPNAAGHDTSTPWGAGETGTGCPSPAGSNFWASTVPSYTDTNPATNWFVWPNGTTVGNFTGSSDIGIAAYNGSATTYTTIMLFTNPGSSTMQSYVQSVLKNCGDHDRWGFAREDNMMSGKQSLNWSVFGSYVPPAYIDLKDFGNTTGGPPYVSAACNGGGNLSFNGSRCTRTAQVSSVSSSSQTFPTDASLMNAYCGMFNSLYHKSGAPWKFMTNGAFSTDPSILNCAHVFATQAEQYITGHCSSTDVVQGSGNNIINPCLAGVWGHTTSFNADNVGTVIDWCAATVFNDPGKQNMVEDYLPNAGNFALGTALSQWGMRAHYGALWSCENDTYPNLMISFSYIGANGAGDTGVYAPDFFEPFHRITPFPQVPNGGAVCGRNNYGNYAGTGAACNSNGIGDPNICRNAAGTGAGTGDSCVVVTEFNDLFTQSTPDLTKWPGSTNYAGTNTTTDLGKGCLIDNNTASGIQVTSTTVNAWCVNTHASLAHVVAWCTPSGYFNTSGSGTIYNMPSSGGGSVCSGSSAKDVTQGGAMNTTTALSSILNEYLPPGDVLMLVP